MMNFKKLAKNILPPGLIPFAVFVAGKTPKQLLKKYINNGYIPWSEGYTVHRGNIIRSSINNDHLLEDFRLNKTLPQSYGLYLDERCVEYPWLFSRLPERATHILDAGSVLNHEYILEHSYFRNKTLHIVTLAPEELCFWEKGISYFFGDLRELPIQENYYDSIVCLSTLEHIGLNNSVYTHSDTYQEIKVTDFKSAIQELKRVLKPGGSIFISVPFGAYQNFGNFQQFDSNLLSEAIAAFGEVHSVNKTFYKYTVNGWQITSEEDCRSCCYADDSEWELVRKTRGIKSKGQPAGLNLAAAARSVACVHIIK